MHQHLSICIVLCALMPLQYLHWWRVHVLWNAVPLSDGACSLGNIMPSHHVHFLFKPDDVDLPETW